jgi:hypothetical protein
MIWEYPQLRVRQWRRSSTCLKNAQASAHDVGTTRHALAEFQVWWRFQAARYHLGSSRHQGPDQALVSAISNRGRSAPSVPPGSSESNLEQMLLAAGHEQLPHRKMAAVLRLCGDYRGSREQNERDSERGIYRIARECAECLSAASRVCEALPMMIIISVNRKEDGKGC